MRPLPLAAFESSTYFFITVPRSVHCFVRAAARFRQTSIVAPKVSTCRRSFPISVLFAIASTTLAATKSSSCRREMVFNCFLMRFLTSVESSDFSRLGSGSPPLNVAPGRFVRATADLPGSSSRIRLFPSSIRLSSPRAWSKLTPSGVDRPSPDWILKKVYL